jgi:hypothetical protein
MGGPWRDRGFDPAAWRTPMVHVKVSDRSAVSGGGDHITGLVIAYVASLATSFAIMLALLKSGW